MAEREGGGWVESNAMRLVQLGVLAAVALLLGLFVLRPLLAPRPPAAPPDLAQPALGAAGPDAPLGLEAPAGATQAAGARLLEAGEAVNADGVAADRLAALREAATEREEDAVALLARWLESDDDGRAKA